MNSSLWTRRSLRNLRNELLKSGYDIGLHTISRLLKKHNYSLKSNIKEVESRSNHPDRDIQFKHIHQKTETCISSNIPIISIDTKKKELVGNFKNNGRDWSISPEKVNVHDFPSDASGIVVPYGIYDISRNEGFVFVGTNNDTPEFAVDNIRKWWELVGSVCYTCKQLVILADCGGSNDCRSRLFKKYLQVKLCDKYGIEVTVLHYPVGCSKWNPIEHRLFSEISKNWFGKPLRSYEMIQKYIKNTKTSTGLKVECVLNPLYYEKGKKVSNDSFNSLNIHPLPYLSTWNYTLKPRQSKQLCFDFIIEKKLQRTGS